MRDCERAIGIDPKYSKAYGRMGYVGPSTPLGTGRGGAADLGGRPRAGGRKGPAPLGDPPPSEAVESPSRCSPLLSCKEVLSGFQGGASLGLFMERHKLNSCAKAV